MLRDMIDLPDRATLRLERGPMSITSARRVNATTYVFAHGGDIATLRLRHPSQLVAATQHAGAALAGHVELPLLQMFAYTAASGELPTQEQCATCVAVAKLAARLVPMNAQAGAMSSADLRRVVAEALLPGRDTITLPQHPWSFAQALCGYGKAQWGLRGAAASWWGSLPVEQESYNDLRSLLSLAAALMVSSSRTSIPIAADGNAAEAIIDWLALAGGPGEPPAEILPDGLGANIEALGLDEVAVDRSMPLDQAHDLQRLAAILLSRVERPMPRYIGRPLDVMLSPSLLPRLALWKISGVRVIPHPRGMWVAALSRDGVHIAAAWWAAQPESSERYPLTFPAAAWTLMHPIFAALWHDLCADAIVVHRRPHDSTTNSAEAQPTTARPARRKPTKRHILLPPPRYVGEWGSNEERAAIDRYVLVGHGYRRLPAGWEERESRRDFQQRQERAAERARSEGMDAPPPGFTYVSSYERGVRSARTGQQPYVVRSRGLFTLMLGLRQVANEESAE